MFKLDKPEYSYLVKGNPGAITVINKLCEKNNYEKILKELQKQCVFGWMLWFIYKDICKFDIDLMIKKIEKQDHAMYARVEKQQDIMRMNDELLGGAR